MPSLPKLHRPRLPNPPHLSGIITDSPLHDVIEGFKSTVQDAESVVGQAQQEVSNIVAAFHTTKSKPAAPPGETIPPQNETKPPSNVTKTPENVIKTSKNVTDEETLKYQHDHITEELNLLETHLSEGCQIAAKSCDCCKKAADRISAYAKESIPIAARQGKSTEVYEQLTEWADSLKPKVNKNAVDSGKYASEYKLESGNASKLRKALESGQPCDTCIKPLSEFIASHKE